MSIDFEFELPLQACPSSVTPPTQNFHLCLSLDASLGPPPAPPSTFLSPSSLLSQRDHPPFTRLTCRLFFDSTRPPPSLPAFPPPPLISGRGNTRESRDTRGRDGEGGRGGDGPSRSTFRRAGWLTYDCAVSSLMFLMALHFYLNASAPPWPAQAPVASVHRRTPASCVLLYINYQSMYI